MTYTVALAGMIKNITYTLEMGIALRNFIVKLIIKGKICYLYLLSLLILLPFDVVFQ